MKTAGKGRLRILLVDDEQGFSEVSKQILEADGNFEVDNVYSVEEAVEKLDKRSYDAVISDYQLPLKNGLDFLRELREKHNNIPFVIFTGKGREEVAIKALNLGADGYYDKHGSTETVYGELTHGIRSAMERVKAKSALEESEKRYRTIMEHAAESIFVHDTKGQIVDVNQLACKNCGYTKKELLSMNIADIDAEETENKKGGLFWSKVLEGQSFTFESAHKRKNGSVFPVEVTLGSITLGKETLVIALTRDITERKQMENALRENEEKFRVVIENAPVFMVILQDNHVKYVNRFTLERLGWTFEEVTSPSFNLFDKIPERFHKLVGENIQKRLSEEHLASYEICIKARNDSEVPVVVHSTKITYLGKPALEVVLADMTERRELAKSLEVQRLMLEDLYENAPAMYYSISPTGVIIKVNNTMCRLLGYTKEELLSKHVSFIQTKKSAEDFAKEYSIVLKSGGAQGFERQFARKDGSVIEVVGDATIEYNKEGEPLFTRAVFRDVTKQKELGLLNRQLIYRLNNLSPGAGYIVESHEQCFKIYGDLTLHGVAGLCIVREDPAKIVEAYGIKSGEVKLLVSKPLKGFGALADLQAVSLAIAEFLRANSSGVVLLDGLEYLVSTFGFDAVYRFIQEKRFDFLEGGALLLMPVDLATLSEKEKALLTSELKLLTEKEK